MIKLDTIKELLDIDENQLREIEIEKLRDLLGVLHYASRIVEHEIDSRNE